MEIDFELLLVFWFAGFLLGYIIETIWLWHLRRKKLVR